MNALATIQVRVLSAQAMREFAKLSAAEQNLMRQTARTTGSVNALGAGAMRTGMLGVTRLGNQVQWAGRQLQYNFSLPLAIAGAAAGKFALDNEKAMVRVIKVYGDGSEVFKQLSKTEIPALGRAFEALSNRFAVNRAEVINIAADWAAAGASGVALAKSTKLTLEAMILGEMEAAEATQALISIQAQYGQTVEQLSQTLDVLNMVENQTGISMQGLIQGFARAAGVARSAGIDVNHLGAMLAALTPASGTASQAGNALKTMISRLLSPTKEAAEVMGLMGVNVKDLGWQSLNGAQRLEVMADKFKDLDDAQKAVVSSVIASRWQINRFDVLMRDITNTNGYYQKSLNATADANRNFQQRIKELNTVLESNPQKLRQVWVILQNAMANVIVPMIPYIVSLAHAIGDWIGKFQQLDGATQKLILALAIFVALVGPVLRYVGSFITLFGYLAYGAGHAAAVLMLFAKSMFALGMAPFSAIGAGLGAVAGFMRKVFLPLPDQATGALSRTSKISLAGFRQIGKVWTWGWGLVLGVFKTAIVGLKANMPAILAFLARVNVAFQYLLFTQLPALFTKAQVLLTRMMVGIMLGINTVMTAAVPVLLSTMSYMMMAVEGVLYRGMIAAKMAMTKGWALLTASSMAAGRTIPVVMASVMTATRSVVAVGGMGIVAVWKAILWVMTNITMIFAKVLPLIFLGGFKAIFIGLKAIGPMLLTAIKTIGPLLIRGLTSTFGLVFTIIATLFLIFRKEIIGVFDDIVSAFSDRAGQFGRAFAPIVTFVNKAVEAVKRAFWRLPEGITGALIAVVKIVRSAALKVYELFSYLNPFAHHSPSLVESVTAGMAEIKKQYSSVGNVGAIFAKAASDLKAFKDIANAMGQGEWADDRANVAAAIPAALPLFDALVGDLKELNQLLAVQDNAVAAQQAVVDQWEASLKDANAALDEQEAALDSLQINLDILTDAYNRHKDAMQAFADAPIQGMGAMSDAIFENEMAQKRLQLQMMDWEDVNGSIDSVRDTLASLAGDIESLTGEASDLRASGAGSDVLGPVNAQIAAMEAQYSALEGAVASSPINQMQQELDALQRQGERLDLENAIQFDPLTRQVDQLVNAMQELPFDQIIAGVTSERAAMDALQPSIDAATAAVNAQKDAVNQSKLARDAIEAVYDSEKDKLQGLQDEYRKTADAISEIEQALRSVGQAAYAAGRGGGGGSDYMSPGAENFLAAAGGNFPDVGGFEQIGREGGLEDQQKMIDDFTKQINDEMSNIFGSFDMFAPIKKYWGQFKGWWNTNVTPVFSGIGGVIGRALGDIDLSGPMKTVKEKFEGVKDAAKEVFGTLGDLFGPIFREIGASITEAFMPAWNEVKDALSKFKDIPIIGTLKGMWNTVKPFLQIFVGGVLAVLSTIFNIIGNIIGPIIDMIAGVISGLIGIVRGVVNIIAGIFTGDGRRIIDGVLMIFGGLFEGIWAIVKGGAQILWGLVKGLVEGVVDFFVWLWDVLVGHSIVPDMIKAIIDWFKNMWDKVVEFVSGLVNAVVNWFKDLNTRARNTIIDMIRAVVQFFVDLKNGIVQIIEDIRNGISEKWELIKSAVAAAASWIKDQATERFNNLKDNIIGAFNYVKDKIGGIFGEINDFIKGGINTGIKAVNSLISGLNKVADILPGLDWHIGSIPLLAQGGAVPSRRVGGGFATSGARAIVGEGKANYPEFVIPTDPTFRNRAEMLYQALGNKLGINNVPMYASGGILGSIKGAIGSAMNTVGSSVDWMKDVATGAVSAIIKPMKDAASKQIDNMTWDFGRRTVRAGFNEVMSWIGQADEAVRQTAPKPGDAGNEHVGGGGWAAITAWLRANSSVPFRITSTYRAGDPGRHGRGLAVDLAGPTPGVDTPQLLAINKALMPIAKTLNELIYAGPGGMSYKLGSPHSYSAAVRADHHDHVHAAMALGGIVKARRGGTVIRAGEAGQDEAVIPLPSDWKALFSVLRHVDPASLKSGSAASARANARVSASANQPPVVAPHYTDNRQYHFHGDLSFPNIKSGEDAEQFLTNLDDLAGV